MHRTTTKMNIIVRAYGSDMCYCRPDTTWERENRDLYSPECVNAWNWTPVLFARISKAGKCINPKFVSRYYDGINFGALLYISGAETAFSSCADHTSFLPLPLHDPIVLQNEGNIFELAKNGESVFTHEIGPDSTLLKTIEESICKASELTTLRIGDFVALELAPAGLLAENAEGSLDIKATFCENEILNFKIIF